MTHFADCASYASCEILKNELIAKDTRLIRFSAPHMAKQVLPGQFFMLRPATGNDPLIGRAFALFDCDPDAGWVEIVYLVKGKFTSQLALANAGATLAVWGPLGNRFSSEAVDRLIMVAGGIGQTPFLALARDALGRKRFGASAHLPPPNHPHAYAQQVQFCYGVRSADYLASVADFQAAGVTLSIATEDGSSGRRGWVTESLTEVLDSDFGGSQRVVCCGPEPMMAAVAKLCDDRRIRCEVSLETPMACGIGICFSCVAKVGTHSDWDYKRTCVDGPIFDATHIVW